MTVARHNHVTRDVKPRGQCPACDLVRAARPDPFARPIDADVATCATCDRTIFRTNVDGNWHHPSSNVDHPAQPKEDKPR